MLFLGLLLAAATATPTPAPGLEQLKTIATVRSTPMCTALREHVGPAIGNVLESDRNIAQSPPIFGSMYHDDVVLHSELRMSFDVLRMENLITPIAKSISSVKSQLRQLPKDPDLDGVRRELQTVIASQNDALNIISGFVETYQLGELQDSGAPRILATSGSSTSGSSTSGSSPAGSRVLLNAGLPQPAGIPRPPGEQSANVDLGYSPYQQFALQLADIREKNDAAEKAASQAVLAAVDRCTAAPSIP